MHDQKSPEVIEFHGFANKTMVSNRAAALYVFIPKRQASRNEK